MYIFQVISTIIVLNHVFLSIEYNASTKHLYAPAHWKGILYTLFHLCVKCIY